MTLRYANRVVSIAAFKRYHRYTLFERTPAGMAERGAVIQPFEVDSDSAHAFVLEQRFDTVRDVDHRLVPGTDSVTQRKTPLDRGNAVQESAASRNDCRGLRTGTFDMSAGAPGRRGVE